MLNLNYISNRFYFEERRFGYNGHKWGNISRIKKFSQGKIFFMDLQELLVYQMYFLYSVLFPVYFVLILLILHL